MKTSTILEVETKLAFVINLKIQLSGNSGKFKTTRTMNCIWQMRGYLTKGAFYPILRENDYNFIVICDSGQEIGFSKFRFKKPWDFYLDVETYLKEKTEKA